MNRTSHLFASLAALLVVPLIANAAPIYYDLSVTASPTSVSTDGGAGKVDFTPTLTATGQSDETDIVLSNLKTATPGGVMDTFTAKAYSLDLEVTDTASGLKGTFTISGLLDGTLSPSMAKIKNTFTSFPSEIKKIGDTWYKLTVGTYVAPGAPSTSTIGSIGATIVASSVKPAGEPLPEPSSLALGGLACLGGALSWWRKRRQERKSAPVVAAEE